MRDIIHIIYKACVYIRRMADNYPRVSSMLDETFMKGFMPWTDHKAIDEAMRIVTKTFPHAINIAKTKNKHNNILAITISFKTREDRDIALKKHRFVRIDDEHEIGFTPSVRTDDFNTMKPVRYMYEAYLDGLKLPNMMTSDVYKVLIDILGENTIYELIRFHPYTHIIYATFDHPSIATKLVEIGSFFVNNNIVYVQQKKSRNPPKQKIAHGIDKRLLNLVSEDITLDFESICIYKHFTEKGKLYMIIENMLHRIALETTDDLLKSELRSMYYDGNHAFFTYLKDINYHCENRRPALLANMMNLAHKVTYVRPDLTSLVETYVRIVQSGTEPC